MIRTLARRRRARRIRRLGWGGWTQAELDAMLTKKITDWNQAGGRLY